MSIDGCHLVVLPAYNEQQSLPATIASLQSLPDGFELLIVNDGSRDLTSQVAHELAAESRLPLHVVDLPQNGGIGVAVQTGYIFAAHQQKYDYVIQFDADGQHDASAIVRLVDACDSRDLDVCIGSRFLNGDGQGFQSTVARRIGIRFLASLISTLGKTKITDPTSGFRCAGPRAWTHFAAQYPDDYPEPESLYWCIRNHLHVGEIPVIMYPRAAGVSSIKTIKAMYYMSKVTLAILVDMIRHKEAVT
ncbi:MAG: glycosyltransferase family 2 protein [Planctomycetales bacterium]|nr:glycosyltransferase family 2 protein [Planctomycetales bacterium]